MTRPRCTLHNRHRELWDLGRFVGEEDNDGNGRAHEGGEQQYHAVREFEEDSYGDDVADLMKSLVQPRGAFSFALGLRSS